MAAAGVKFWLEVEQGRESAQSDMIECASAVAQLFDEMLTGQIENLEALAGARALDRIRSEDLVDAAARIKRHHEFVHRLVAVLPDGTITAASDPPSAVSPAPFAARDALRAGLARSPGSRRSAPAELDGRPPDGADRGADSRRSGAPLGATAAEIDLAALSAYLDRVPLDARNIRGHRDRFGHAGGAHRCQPRVARPDAAGCPEAPSR